MAALTVSSHLLVGDLSIVVFGIDSCVCWGVLANEAWDRYSALSVVLRTIPDMGSL